MQYIEIETDRVERSGDRERLLTWAQAWELGVGTWTAAGFLDSIEWFDYVKTPGVKQTPLIEKSQEKKREEEGKAKEDLILIVSGTFSKSITGPFFNTNCSVWNRKEPGFVSHDWQLQQQSMLAGPAHRWASTSDEPLRTCPARSKKGSPLHTANTPTCGKSVCLHLPEGGLTQGAVFASSLLIPWDSLHLPTEKENFSHPWV